MENISTSIDVCNIAPMILDTNIGGPTIECNQHKPIGKHTKLIGKDAFIVNFYEE